MVLVVMVLVITGLVGIMMAVELVGIMMGMVVVITMLSIFPQKAVGCLGL
jgi:hypothetical protein